MIQLNLDGRAALVTGGSRGIGRGISIALAEAGADVVLTYERRGGEAFTVARDIEKAGRRGIVIQGDVRQRADMDAAVSLTLRELGRLDILICNAGITGQLKSAAETLFEDWQAVFDVNVNGTFHAVQAALPALRQSGYGSIITISSFVTARPLIGRGGYASAKAAVETFTRILAFEEAAHRIRVNCVAPGLTDTDMGRNVLEQFDKARRDALINGIPLKRLGLVEEVAAVVVFLCSDLASYLTGQVIFVNGGGRLF